MLTLERLWHAARRLPALAQAGLGVMAFGGLADVMAHLEAGVVEAGAAHAHTSTEAAAHLTGFVGMVLILVGVVMDGVRRRPTSPDTRSKGGS